MNLKIGDKVKVTKLFCFKNNSDMAHFLELENYAVGIDPEFDVVYTITGKSFEINTPVF